MSWPISGLIRVTGLPVEAVSLTYCFTAALQSKPDTDPRLSGCEMWSPTCDWSEGADEVGRTDEQTAGGHAGLLVWPWIFFFFWTSPIFLSSNPEHGGTQLPLPGWPHRRLFLAAALNFYSPHTPLSFAVKLFLTEPCLFLWTNLTLLLYQRWQWAEWQSRRKH